MFYFKIYFVFMCVVCIDNDVPYVYEYPWKREEGVIFPRIIIIALVTI